MMMISLYILSLILLSRRMDAMRTETSDLESNATAVDLVILVDTAALENESKECRVRQQFIADHIHVIDESKDNRITYIEFDEDGAASYVTHMLRSVTMDHISLFIGGSPCKTGAGGVPNLNDALSIAIEHFAGDSSGNRTKVMTIFNSGEIDIDSDEYSDLCSKFDEFADSITVLSVYFEQSECGSGDSELEPSPNVNVHPLCLTQSVPERMSFYNYCEAQLAVNSGDFKRRLQKEIYEEPVPSHNPTTDPTTVPTADPIPLSCGDIGSLLLDHDGNTHECVCMSDGSDCGDRSTSYYCNSAQFVADRMDSTLQFEADELCPDSEASVCCCHCRNFCTDHRSSSNPTADPTRDPTTDPTRDPTADPTRRPTLSPLHGW